MDKKQGARVILLGVGALALVGLASSKALKPEEYRCGIDSQVFDTLDALYQHWKAQHGTQPITVTWS